MEMSIGSNRFTPELIILGSRVRQDSMLTVDEVLIDAKLEEVDQWLEKLRKWRQELQQAKEAMKAGRTFRNASTWPTFTGLTSLEKTVQLLRWKSFRKNMEGEWTFDKEVG